VHTFLLITEFGIVDAFILVVACIGFSLQFGVTNYVNFAYAAFITFGAYMAYAVDSTFHVNLALAFVGAALSTGLLAFVIGRFVYGPFVKRRPQLLFVLVLTFAVWSILDATYLIIWGTDYKQLSFNLQNAYLVGPFNITSAEVLFILLGLGSLVAVHSILRYTRLGKSMRAMSDDLSLARVCGLNTQRITDITWVISGCLAGIAGVVQAIQASSFTTALGDNFVYLIFAAVTFGGIGRIYGAVVGALVIGLTIQLTVPVIGAALSPGMVFVVLVAMMLVRPNGLLGPTGRTVFGRA
jgi:branched-chain amino acid transport system permease protein/neutral amino acid transport system permease protein